MERLCLFSSIFLGALSVADASLGAEYQAGRLVVAEEVQRLSMRHNVSFKRSKAFTTYDNLLIVPAESEPKVGMWSMGAFKTKYEGASKTSCTFSQQTNCYMPGNNRVVHSNKTVAECKQLCCDDEVCQSFDYGKSGAEANYCFLSKFVEGASGLVCGAAASDYDYYEVKHTEVISQLGVIKDGSSVLLVGSARQSGNLYQYRLEKDLVPPRLTPLGAYVAPSASAAGHSETVLTLVVATWANKQYLVTGGYDKTLIIWSLTGSTLLAKQKIDGFGWPLWAIAVGNTKDKVFVGGDHADISRWTLPTVLGSSSLTAGGQTQWLKGHSRLVRCLAYDSTNSVLASGSEDTRIILWKLGTDGNFKFGAKLFDHTDAVKSLTFATPNTQSLLISTGDDGNIMIFDPKADDTTCNFEKQLNYYLPGNNRYVFEYSTLAECMKICCESVWCSSFDYATKADELYGANTCWMSPNMEGSAGLGYSSSGTYHYYEIAKRGTRMLQVKQPGPVAMLNYVPAPVNLMVVSQSGDASNPGGISSMKITEVTCPDGLAPNYEGTECVECRLGFAGKGGQCNECPPGKFAPKEGSFECIDCPMGWASSVTETPNLFMVEDLWGLVKCTECPKWALATKTKQNFCEWCPPGEYPAADRKSCVGPGRGHDSVAGKTDWTESWGRDGQERSDAFCPTGKTGGALDSCSYPPAHVANINCPMACPRNYQVEVDKDWNPKGMRGFSFTTDFDVSWKCVIKNKTAQEMCNKLLCSGALVSMQGSHEKDSCIKDRTDCTCAEDLRESCKGGLLRLREEQCRAQCTPNWCHHMCQAERAREFTGIFKSDNVENPFTVLRCEAKGTQCVATCKNAQRRLTSTRDCGTFDIWDTGKNKFLITNDALCGSEAVFEKRSRSRYDQHGGHSQYVEEVFVGTRLSDAVCTQGSMDKVRHPQTTSRHTTYRPSACVGANGVHAVGPRLFSALVSLALIATQL